MCTRGRQQNHLKILLWYTKSDCTRLVGHLRHKRRAEEPFPYNPFPQQPEKKIMGRIETLLASCNRTECRKLKNKMRNRCQGGKQTKSTCRNLDITWRDRRMSALQEDCTPGRTAPILCKPAKKTHQKTETHLLNRVMDFCGCKLLYTWTKVYASKARISKIWAFPPYSHPKTVSRKYLPTHSLPYNFMQLSF